MYKTHKIDRYDLDISKNGMSIKDEMKTTDRFRYWKERDVHWEEDWMNFFNQFVRAFRRVQSF